MPNATPKTDLVYCKEDDQRNENANEHIPSAHGAEALSAQMDVHNLGMDMQSVTVNARMPANERRNVRTCRIRSRICSDIIELQSLAPSGARSNMYA